jgi:hypothetical protein
MVKKYSLTIFWALLACIGVNAQIFDGYYSIKNNGNGKYVDVKGRRTVVFTPSTGIANAAGTVIKLKTTSTEKGTAVVELRAQACDLPSYANRGMKYVTEMVQLAIDKLHAEGAGTILGENGFDAIMEKFDASFDKNLYLEAADGGYRIYGKTPDMTPVAEFYNEHMDQVNAKLPQLEQFINDAIKKILEKTGGRGAGILVEFKLHDVWTNMGDNTLTEPLDDASKLEFLKQVLANKERVWNFAYETAMIYYKKFKDNTTVKENLDKLGEYAQYLDKIENVRPDFKYYIVANGDKIDFASEGNANILASDPSTIWSVEERSDFTVTFDNVNVKNEGSEHYTTFYADFAYSLPEGVKAYKVIEVKDNTIGENYGAVQMEEMEGVIPAQTPVILVSTNETLEQTLTLVPNDNSKAPTDNQLEGNDYLVSNYQIEAPSVAGLFDLIKRLIGETAYANNFAKYDHLKYKNAGTVNNKYFFGLDNEDLEKCVYGEENHCVTRGLDIGDNGLGFYENWVADANKAFLVSEKYDAILLTMWPDVDRDGIIGIGDVTACVDIILGGDNTKPYLYDHDAADTNRDNIINVTDVSLIVNIILGQ